MNSLSLYLSRVRNRHFFAVDALTFLVTPALALVIRLDGLQDISFYLQNLALVTLLFLAIKLVVLQQFGFYRYCWRYASIDELTTTAVAALATVLLQSLVLQTLSFFIPQFQALPRSLPLLDGLLSFILVGLFRFSIRTTERIEQRTSQDLGDCTLIVGAGNTGIAIVQEMQRNPQLGFHPVAFVDDATEKINLKIRGVPVVGDRRMIPELIRPFNIRHAVIAMPTAPGDVIREIVEVCQASGVKTSILPAMQAVLSEKEKHEPTKNLREIQIEDLLRREPIQTDLNRVAELLRGKRVLITGAGGSIGSELCRQILRCRPAEMILLGKGENSIFQIQQELQRTAQILAKSSRFPKSVVHIEVFIADIRSQERLNYAFEQCRPDVIFHAAAHKHVPLMELNPPEAITSNVLGTKNLLDMALQHEVEHFVMISTDKAVNPSNVMGASKRVAEMLVLQAARQSGKPYVAVRFGNVLGSRGSVVPTFKRQIAAGGPVTVTHPEVCRYFITIPEAVQLVLQAAVLGHGGEVLMLDMGDPVKIVDLAKDLIRLSGYEVGKDIDIAFTGLRPGEKLYEELFIPGEEYERTQHHKILMVRNASHTVAKGLEMAVNALCQAAERNDAPSILFLLEQLVCGYKPQYPANSASVQNLALAKRSEPSQDTLYPPLKNVS